VCVRACVYVCVCVWCVCVCVHAWTQQRKEAQPCDRVVDAHTTSKRCDAHLADATAPTQVERGNRSVRLEAVGQQLCLLVRVQAPGLRRDAGATKGRDSTAWVNMS
jgi:hypothetical protein